MTNLRLQSKELEPGGWKCITGRAPSKDDMVKGAVAIRALGTKRFMYINFQRAGVNGDAQMDWELNQSAEPSPACVGLPRRTSGVIVITFDTDNGGKTSSSGRLCGRAPLRPAPSLSLLLETPPGQL